VTHRAQPRRAAMRRSPIPWHPPQSSLHALGSHSCYGDDATRRPEERLSIFHIKRDTTFLASGLLIRIRLNPDPWIQFVLLGVVLAFAYLAKAVMFPLAFVFLVAAFFSLGKPRNALPRVLVAAFAFVICNAPFLLALHEVKGRWTFSDTGHLAYAWLVDETEFAFLHWRGKPAGTGTLPILPIKSSRPPRSMNTKTP